MLLGCFLPFVSNAKIEKVESYVWTGFKGGAACEAVDQACEYENGFKANGCPIIDTKYDGLTSYKFKGCGTGSSKLVCDGSRDGKVLTNTCECPSGMTDITSIYLNKNAKGLFHQLYPNAGDVLKIFNYEELQGKDNYASKQKVCAYLNKLECKHGNLKSSDIITMLGIKSSNNPKPAIKDLDGDKNIDNSYNEYTFYNDRPNFGITTTGFQFNGYVCLDDNDKTLKIQGICTDCKANEKSGYPLISTTDIDCGSYVLKGQFVMTLWNGKKQPIYYCGACDLSGNEDNDYVVSYSSSCINGHNVYQTGIEYAGFINGEWKINQCKKCRNQCSGYPSLVASGLYLHIEQPEDYKTLTYGGYRGGGDLPYCPITCPYNTDVAFATTTPEIIASASGITSAMFDKCGDYSRVAAENGGALVSEYLLYNVDASVTNNNGRLVCAKAVSCNYAENYVERTSTASARWCSFWPSEEVDPTGYSNECGCKKEGYTFLCDGTGQTGDGDPCIMGNQQLYQSCNCSTKGYTKTCTGTGQTGDGEYCELPSGQRYYQSCKCRYTLKCSDPGQIGVGAYCTDDNGVKYYKQCGSSEPAEPEVPDSGEEVYNYCSIDDPISAIQCQVNALQTASETDGYTLEYSGEGEFAPINQNVQLAGLVITSQAHYEVVRNMLSEIADGQTSLLYSEDKGKEWKEDAGKYIEGAIYAIDPYVYSVKFMESGIHWLSKASTSKDFESFQSAIKEANEIMKSGKPDDARNFAENLSYMVNYSDGKNYMSFLHSKVGGTPDALSLIEKEGEYYIPYTDKALENLRQKIDILENYKIDDIKGKDAFLYYLLNGYLQVDKSYYKS